MSPPVIRQPIALQLGDGWSTHVDDFAELMSTAESALRMALRDGERKGFDRATGLSKAPTPSPTRRRSCLGYNEQDVPGAKGWFQTWSMQSCPIAFG
jgi:hypothetical protein